MSPQTGPDLVSAGYPISRPLLALLGGNGNLAQSNVPIYTNLDFGLGGLADTALNPASVYCVAVPVTPGATISKITVLIGATAGGSITQGWGALYTGTGSAPGTANVSPTLIGQTLSASVPSAQASNVGSATTVPVAGAPWSFLFSTPQTITSSQAPYGYVYAVVSASPACSTVTMTCACVCYYPYFATSPVFVVATSGSAQAASAAMGAVNKVAAPPVVLLS